MVQHRYVENAYNIHLRTILQVSLILHFGHFRAGVSSDAEGANINLYHFV